MALILPETEPALLAAELPSAYNKANYSDEQYAAERARVLAELATEQQWVEDADLGSYATDPDILLDVSVDRLTMVTHGVGFLATSKLRYWAPSHSNPAHHLHYSPPALALPAARMLQSIGREWNMRAPRTAPDLLLSVTSMTRSELYQHALVTKAGDRKLAAPKSTHTTGYAFDLDACGMYLQGPLGGVEGINPRNPNRYDAMAEAIAEARARLRAVLAEQEEVGTLHAIEELPGTQQHVFHVAINPTV